METRAKMWIKLGDEDMFLAVEAVRQLRELLGDEDLDFDHMIRFAIRNFDRTVEAYRKHYENQADDA